MKIIVVDDSETSRLLHKTILRRLFNDAIIKDFEDGVGAMDYINSESDKCDVIITDYEMPNKNGVELAKEVHSLFPEVITVCVSSTLNVEQVFDYYIQKPVNKEDIRKVMIDLLLKRRNNAQR